LIVKSPRYVRRRFHAAQQPAWDDSYQLAEVRSVLSANEALVHADQIVALRRSLELVARGRALVLQAGDCAEDPDECAAPYIAAKRTLLHRLAGVLGAASGLPVIRVGRIAGQFAKPRSEPVDRINGTVLPAFRGQIVNAPEFDPHSRRADPLRMLTCFRAAREAMHHLGWRADDWAERGFEDRIWTSHEALLLDYERPLIRLDRRRLMLGSTHWPWIGDRTRQVDGAHVALLSNVINPVGCKIGPSITPAELIELCRRLDPHREPGRLALIVRMGADVIVDRLPALVRTVRGDGHPVLWLSDPMHGNTVKRADGSKVRVVATIIEELQQFLSVMRDAGVMAHGLHLEATPYPVTECVGLAGSPLPVPVGPPKPTLCDPRLNPEQAAQVVSAWTPRRQPAGRVRSHR
jgi:3-deoxy-7-phosphoheptulonate synthase